MTNPTAKNAPTPPAWVNPIWWRNMEQRRKDAAAARARMRQDTGRVRL